MSTTSKIQEYCGSCGKGWWCMGCGYMLKEQALKKHFDDNMVANILYSTMGCGVLVPCFICNKRGQLPCSIDCEYIPNFWEYWD